MEKNCFEEFLFRIIHFTNIQIVIPRSTLYVIPRIFQVVFVAKMNFHIFFAKFGFLYCLCLKKWAILGLFCPYLYFLNKVICVQVNGEQRVPMAGIEPWSSGVGSCSSANCSTLQFLLSCHSLQVHQNTPNHPIQSFIVRTNRSTLHTDPCSTYNSLTGRKSQSVYNMFTPRPWKEVNYGVQMTYLVLYL